MFSKTLRRVLKLTAKPLAFISLLSLYSYFSKFNHSYQFTFLGSKVECSEKVFVDMKQLLNFMKTTEKQMIILVFNKQSYEQLKNQFEYIFDEGKKLGIDKFLLIDYSQIRHLRNLSKSYTYNQWSNTEQKSQNKVTKNKQSINLYGKIKIFYINPIYQNQQFYIQSKQVLYEQINQIRSYFKFNPTKQQLQQSISTFNRTTVIKNCYDETCIKKYQQTIGKLISLQLLKKKKQNYVFYLANENSYIYNMINKYLKSQQMYVFKNDILGKDKQIYSQFLEKQGKQYQSYSQFFMMIRPRIHILSTKSDWQWYKFTTNINQVPTFAINNTLSNLSATVTNNSKNVDENNYNHQQNNVIFLKGHYQQVELIRKLKQKYGSNIEILIMQNQSISSYMNHYKRPERYSIFKFQLSTIYPKMFIKSPILKMQMSIWNKMKKIQQTQKLSNQNNGLCQLDGDHHSWQKTINRVNIFMQHPKHYNILTFYKSKQIEINGQQLKDLLQHKHIPQIDDILLEQLNKRWIFRICGPSNNCLESAHQKYKIHGSIPIFYLNTMMENIAIDEGDYQVTNNQIQILT